jgi:hypothetical protein
MLSQPRLSDGAGGKIRSVSTSLTPLTGYLSFSVLRTTTKKNLTQRRKERKGKAKKKKFLSFLVLPGFLFFFALFAPLREVLLEGAF